MTVTPTGRGVESADGRLEEESPSAARLRALLEGMLDPVVTIDRFGTIQDVSRSVGTVFGYERGELLGRNVDLLMPEPHSSQHDDYLANYRKTGETNILGQTREFDVVHKDGTLIPCELSVSRVEVPGADEPLFIGSFRDVRARKEAQQALLESEQRFRAIFEQEFQLVGLLRPDGVVLEANRAALAVADATRDEVVGRPFWETRPWAVSEEAKRRLEDAVARAAAGEFVRFEGKYRGRAGDIREVDFSLKPIRDEAGKVVLLLPEGRDITFLKRSQRRETAMLRALAGIGESASVLAHEIKNPITAVNIALRAVADQLGEDERMVLEDLVARMKKLEQTMHRTLSFARPIELEWRRVQPRRILEEVAMSMGPYVTEAGAALDVEVDPACGEFEGDPALLEEVITNLVRNSIEALESRPDGRVVLSARAAGGESVVFQVDDDGPGVPPELGSDLFKPFVSGRHGGTGLGLALCLKIAEAHGGTLGVSKSDLGGARFVLELPGEAFVRMEPSKCQNDLPETMEPIDLSVTVPASPSND